MNDHRLLSVEGLSLETGEGRVLVDNISFHLDRREILALVGESGSGKTLTSLALMDLLPAGVRKTAGALTLEGERLDAATVARLRGCRMATVFQEPMSSMNPTLRIGEQIAEVLVRHSRLGWKQAQQQAVTLLDRVGIVDPALRARQYIHQLSGGMRQRVMIASAIAGRPQLLIADEPTTALDVTIQAQILSLLQELQREMGMGILLITHDLSVVARYADRVCVMQQGQLVEQGETVTTLSHPVHPYTRRLVDASSLPLPAESAPVNAPPLLELSAVSKSYPLPRALPFCPAKKHTVLYPLDLSIAQGEIVGVIGESGSGKTTLGSAAIGLIEADTGEIRFLGEALRGRQRNALRRHCQIIFQDPYSSLDPRMTVGEQIAEPLRVWQLRRGEAAVQARVHELLALVGLQEEHAARLPAAFSGGQRQRIVIARALAMEPKLLVADEAVAALDLSVRGQILSLFDTLRHRLGLSILFISHDLSAVRQLCDRIVVMYHGKIVEEGSTTQVTGQPQAPYTRRLLAAAPDVRQALLQRGGSAL